MKRKSYVFFIAILYALIITSIPWDIIRGAQFEDYLNYIQRINDLKGVGTSYINPRGSILGALTSESLWGYLLLAVANSSINPDYFLTAMSLITLSTISYYILRNTPVMFGVILLTNPLMIDFVMSQHRNALAISLLIYAIMVDKKFIFCLLATVAAFIHTASLVIFSGYLFCEIISKNNITNKFFLKKTITIIAGIAIGLALTLGRELILGSIGDRRVEYNAESVSLLYASFWFLLLAALLLFYKKKYDPIYYFTILNLTTFTLLAFLNTYSVRFLAIAYPFIIICIYNLKKNFPILLFALLIFNQAIQWYFWI